MKVRKQFGPSTYFKIFTNCLKFVFYEENLDKKNESSLIWEWLKV